MKGGVREQTARLLNAPSRLQHVREPAARMTDKSYGPINQINPLNPQQHCTESLLCYFFQRSTANTFSISTFIFLNSQTAGVESAEKSKSNVCSAFPNQSSLKET